MTSVTTYGLQQLLDAPTVDDIAHGESRNVESLSPFKVKKYLSVISCWQRLRYAGIKN